jgi:hypothetical protein
MGCSWATFLPLLCGFKALIIGKVTEQEAICPDFHNRMNIYDTEPVLCPEFSRCRMGILSNI